MPRFEKQLLSVRYPYISAVSCGGRIYPARLFLHRAAFQTAPAHAPGIFGFLSLKPPFSHISVHLLGKLTSAAIRSAGIVPGGRKCGPHAFRASLASSMVNDDVPYEVVRNTLGHTDVNAIKSYAKLDVERLRVYALAVPEATGYFAKFLSGGRENA